MVAKELLELLACPQNHQPLREAPPELLARVNARIARGELANQGGVKLQAALLEALVREDGELLYPVLDGIPMLLAEEAIHTAETPRAK
ncbi:MAG: hypothetical protein EXS08_00915 [Planctomycetes bacterium]|nr:hypothetical protein [Planctomycetota bacterium]